MEGDVFQGMIFWWHAAMLLRSSSKVVRVVIENDGAAGVDDISIHYALPGIDAGGRPCAADYYQVKYHVDRSSEYAADTFCDPSFINATRSLLQRFHDARSRLGDADGWHRLHLISNWQWSATDKLGPLLRLSEEGALPDRFFTDGARSALGKIRLAWRDHLELTADAFEDWPIRVSGGRELVTWRARGSAHVTARASRARDGRLEATRRAARRSRTMRA